MFACAARYPPSPRNSAKHWVDNVLFMGVNYFRVFSRNRFVIIFRAAWRGGYQQAGNVVTYGRLASCEINAVIDIHTNTTIFKYIFYYYQSGCHNVSMNG